MPAPSANTRYSGKNGAIATHSLPGVDSAFSVIVSDAAAPHVMYRSAAETPA